MDKHAKTYHGQNNIPHMSHYLFIKDLPASLQKPNDLPVQSWHISLSQWQMAPRGHQASHVPPADWLMGCISHFGLAISVGIRWITWQRWQRRNKEVDWSSKASLFSCGHGSHSKPWWTRIHSQVEPKHLYDSTCKNQWNTSKSQIEKNFTKLYQTSKQPKNCRSAGKLTLPCGADPRFDGMLKFYGGTKHSFADGFHMCHANTKIVLQAWSWGPLCLCWSWHHLQDP